MAIVYIMLGIAVAFSFGMAAYYRQQIKSIESQIAFLNHHETNMTITGDYGTGCVAGLIEQLNIMIAKTAELRKKSADNEAHIKDTIINLSHDIRTPLTSLGGYFQLLLKSEQADEQRQYAEIINNQLFSLKEILDELFTYAKISNKSYEIELVPCHIKETLLSVLFGFYNDFKHKGIEPQIDLPEGDIMVLSNEAALRRIFQNILKNSIEHGKSHLSIVLAASDNKVHICFENDYLASEPIDAEKVFERFYKADGARNRTSTGLGLSIAKELVQRLDGSIASDVQNDIFTISVIFHAYG